MGLGVVLLLLVLLDRSCAEPIKKVKVTDPNYMHYVMNGGDATITSYKHHGYGSKPSPRVTAKSNFTVASCTVRFPGIVDGSPAPDKPDGVSFW
jgi:hypothetical protein